MRVERDGRITGSPSTGAAPERPVSMASSVIDGPFGQRPAAVPIQDAQQARSRRD